MGREIADWEKKADEQIEELNFWDSQCKCAIEEDSCIRSFLTNWELDFLTNVRDQIVKKGFVSDKQKDVIEKIMYKMENKKDDIA